MSLYKGVYFLLLTVLITTCSIYYLGCSSAESTTGKLAFGQQDYLKAESELKKGLAIDPKDDEGWYMLGYSQIELGKNSEAQSSFKKSLSISNNFAEKIKFLWIEKFNAGAKDFKNGIDAEEKKDKAGAKTFYENALYSFEASSAIFPDSLKSMSAIGETYLALGQNEKALEILNDIASKTNSPQAAMKVAKILFESGLSMMQTKNYPAAITTFKKIQSISTLPKDDPYYETSAYNTGLALAKLGEDLRNKDENSNYKEKYTEALTYLEPLTVNLKNKDIQLQMYELIVTVYANLGMTDKAQDALNKKEQLKGSK
ncbi:MAG: tetratricopeptide repeat protein [Bacteroidota bacterium]|nr:tetratricopeptide repeat protein [Bacteroidota bacterium]